jgi:hypothetical protein
VTSRLKVTLEHVYLFTMFYYEHVFICLHFVYIVSNWLIFFCHPLKGIWGSAYRQNLWAPTKLAVLFKKNIICQSKIYNNHFQKSNFWGMWPLGHVGHVTYSFINMLFISTGIFDDKLRPQILSFFALSVH